MSKTAIEQADSGGKGYGLQKLEALSGELDFKVPGYNIIPPKLFAEFQIAAAQANTIGSLNALLNDREPSQTALPSGIEILVQEYAKKYKGRKVQVRSNSKREGGSHSFRGRYDSITVESVDEASLRVACWAVYKSLHSERAVTYRLENEIPDDEMGIIIQEFVDGEAYGVVHTSKPNYPAAITISVAAQHGGVTDDSDTPIEIYEYVKTKSEPQLLFSTDAHPTDHSGWNMRLARIAQKIEAELGHSELEFAIRDGDIYLLQYDALRNVQEAEHVEIPEYNSEAFLGETYMAHGNGMTTLPVVRMENLDDILLRLMQGGAANQKMEMVALTLIEGWMTNIQRLDRKYSDGYILVTTHFNETMFRNYSMYSLISTANIPSNCNFDSLTPNKKMIVTTTLATPSCHAITVAREKGTLYAGFQDKDGEEIFNSINTGELVSAYFSNGKALLYKESSPEKSITEFGVSISESGELKLPVDSAAEVQSFGEAVARELSSLTSLKWRYEPNSRLIGGLLRCENEEYSTGLTGHRMANQHTVLHLDPAYVHNEIKSAVEELLTRL